jgi:hypothetical protein
MRYPPSPAIAQIDASSIDRVHYEWDAWDPYSVLGDSDLQTQAVLRGTSDRAKLTYAIACSEWVVQQLSPLMEKDATPWQFIEACWAFEMSGRYALPPESDEDQWQGPVRAAVDLSLMTILNTAFGFEDDNAEVDAAFAESIARHVVVDKDVFDRWRKIVLDRLQVLHPLDELNHLGAPIPREVVDIASTSDAEQYMPMVEKFLAELRTDSNPFLVPIARDQGAN